jgi:hemerythrin
VRTLLLRVVLVQEDQPELATSSLVVDFLELLRACQPVPDLPDAGDTTEAVIMPWSDLYSVGVDEIDQQHRVLVGLINRLDAGSRKGGDAESVDAVLAALVDYMREHFADEERLMREHDYPDADAHVAAHARLTERVRTMVQRSDQGATPPLRELKLFLRQWFISHVLHTDKALGTALRDAGVR